MSPNGTLHMDTEAIRAMAARLARFADTLRSTNSRIIRMAEVIDWNGPAHDEFMGEIDRWSRNFRPYVDTSHLMSQQLKNEADEWEAAAASLQTIGSLPSYVHPENINSVDPERIADIKIYLMSTPYGQELLKLFEEYDVEIVFGSIDDPSTIASTSADGRRITIDIDHANLSDAELAAILVHEGTHAKQGAYPDENIPLIGDLFNLDHLIRDTFEYKLYPWLNEYEAYRAEADFWNAVGEGLPASQSIQNHFNMIFTPDGGYRNYFDAMQILHDRADYGHLFDPNPFSN